MRDIIDPLSAEPITAERFRFLNFDDPESFFSQAKRPLRLIHSRPNLENFSDAIYTPATRSSKPFSGCLYDRDRNRIEASCIKRRTTDRCLNLDDVHYQGPIQELPSFDGEVLYLGFINPHYGHFLLETLSRWWAIAEAGKEVSHFLVHIHEKAVLNQPHVRSCMDALGISLDKVVYFTKPTKITRLAVPTPAFQINSHIYAEYQSLCNKIASRLCDGQNRRTEQPIYFSRSLLSNGVREYVGETKLEELLKSRGVRIVHPQQLSFEDQVTTINQHKHILGLMGSAMHNLVFSLTKPTAVHMAPNWIDASYFLTDTSAKADSYYLNASARRNNLHSHWLRMQKRFRSNNQQKVEDFGEHHSLDLDRISHCLSTIGYV